MPARPRCIAALLLCLLGGAWLTLDDQLGPGWRGIQRREPASDPFAGALAVLVAPAADQEIARSGMCRVVAGAGVESFELVERAITAPRELCHPLAHVDAATKAFGTATSLLAGCSATAV